MFRINWIKGIAARLRNAERTRTRRKNHLEVARSEVLEIRTLMSGKPIDAVSFATPLHNGGASDQAVAAAEKGAGYSASDVATALKSVYGDSDLQVAAAENGAGYSASDVATALKSVYGDSDLLEMAVKKGASVAAKKRILAVRKGAS